MPNNKLNHNETIVLQALQKIDAEILSCKYEFLPGDKVRVQIRSDPPCKGSRKFISIVKYDLNELNKMELKVLVNHLMHDHNTKYGLEMD